MRNTSKNQGLLGVMELCGHFLYHRRGGKVSQGKILRILHKEGDMMQKDLQKLLGIQAGSLSETLGKLEGAGLIKRERMETDRRQTTLCLTSEGLKTLEERATENRMREEHLFDVLTAQEQKTLEETLTRLLKSWQEQYDAKLFEHRKHAHKKEGDPHD